MHQQAATARSGGGGLRASATTEALACIHARMHARARPCPCLRSNRAYYAASTLGGLSGADQRITEDVEKFAYAASELYSHTFKVRMHACVRVCVPLAGSTNMHMYPALFCGGNPKSHLCCCS